MTGVVADPEDDAVAIERMLDDGAPSTVYRPRVGRRSRWTPSPMPPEPSTEERAVQRRATRRVFRVYCVACGRSTDVLVAPARPGRCQHCDGTLLVEVAAD